MTGKIVDLHRSRDAAEDERIAAIAMKLASAIAKAVVEDEPIDTAALLQEVDRLGQSVGVRAAREAMAIAWSRKADILKDFMNLAAEDLGAAGVFGYAKTDQ